MAKTLTISDQHATILLTSSSAEENQEEEIKSLLKLTLVPFHKSILAFVPKDTAATTSDAKEEDTEKKEEAEKEHSKTILQFLSQFDFRMTSESGAEYSFHEAFLKSSPEKKAHNDKEEDDSAPLAKKFKAAIATTTDDDVVNMDQGKAVAPPPPQNKYASFKVELISPASPRQLLRALPSPGFSLVTETPHLYNSITKPFIDSIVSSGSLSWIQNVISGQKEKERLLHNANDWILNIDTKWRTHPDAHKVKREEWHHHKSTVDLYCLAILKTPNITSLRDLRPHHLPTLREILHTGPQIISQIYGVPPHQLKIFVHYPPQFYHFHIHFTRLENDVGSQVEKAHLLQDVIQNLEMDGLFYEKRVVTYKLSLKDKLYKLIAAEETKEEEKVKKDEDAEMEENEKKETKKEEEDTEKKNGMDKEENDDAVMKDANDTKDKEMEVQAEKEADASTATKTSG